MGDGAATHLDALLETSAVPVSAVPVQSITASQCSHEGQTVMTVIITNGFSSGDGARQLAGLFAATCSKRDIKYLDKLFR